MNDDDGTDDAWHTSDLTGRTAGGPDSAELAAIGGDASIDDMARTLSTFGMRLDALVTSTTSYRSAITDRLVEYADTVNRLVKNQSADLEEHRSSNQRLLSELQSGISASDASVSSLAVRIDDLLKGSTGDGAQDVLLEVRSILEAQERLGQFLTEALDQFGDRVTERLDGVGVGDELASLTGSLAAIEASDTTVETGVKALRADVASLRDSLVELASGDVVGALWDEVRALRSVVEELRSKGVHSQTPAQASTPLVARETFAAVDAIAIDLTRLRADLTDGLVIEADDSLSEHLEDIRTRLTELAQADVAVSPDAAAMDAVAASVDEMRAALSQGVDARPTPELADQLAEIRSAVVATSARLDEGLVIDVSDNDVADHVASLRDEVTAELEAVRQILADALDRPSAVTEELTAELAALRRRIKVRSEADVLTNDQLDRIAQAVADRLE